jgi:hypothetical protein
MSQSREKIEPFYMKRAEEFIDCLYDKGYFREDVKRDDMRKLDEFLGFLFQTQCQSAVTCSELTRRISK